MELMTPELLEKVVQKNHDVRIGIAILKDQCQDVVDDTPFHNQKISVNDVKIAKELSQTNLFKTKIDFDDYQSVHQFIVKNSNFLDSSSQKWLLEPFE